MRNPVTWDLFCEHFDALLPICLPEHHRIVHRFIDQDIFEDSPNMLFYHAEGFPIQLLLDYMFRKKYGPFIRNQCQVSQDLEYFETQHFIEFDFHHPNFQKQSEACIELLKQIVKNPSVCGSRHLIVLKNIDGAILYSKQMFRVLLERFSRNALFICTTASFSKLEAPIRSRFMMIRIPLPSNDEIKAIMDYLNLPFVESTDRLTYNNIYKALLIQDIIMNHPNEDVATLCKYHFPLLGQSSLSSASLDTLRTLSNKICQTNIPFRGIVLDLLNMIRCDCAKMNFISDAVDIEHKLSCTNGGRQMLYIEMLLHRARFHMKS